FGIEELRLLTFPSEEMQDLHLFVDEGLLTWEETETGAYRMKRGAVFCFEKSSTISKYLAEKLVAAKVYPQEFGSYLQEKYKGIMAGSNPMFPLDVINLDYDGNISKNPVHIGEVIELLFKFQEIHNKSFNLFLTWPQTKDEDTDEYIKWLKNTVRDNLSNPIAKPFKDLFDQSFQSIDSLHYEQLSIIGITKHMVKVAADHGYTIEKNEFYNYGEKGRRNMMSVLIYFKHIDNTKPSHQVYSEEIVKTLDAINVLS
ncbi:hypothetical protein ACFL57_00720, partial [Candidatus Margulisiibacteriota bacterium]